MDYISNYQFGSDISLIFQKHIIKKCNEKAVLDLGCGQGDYLKFFGPHSLGLDLSPQNIKSAHTSYPIKAADLNNPPEIKQKFDIVFMSHVLEHVESPINLLKYAHKQLKPNGTIIVAVPNELSLIHKVYPYYTKNGNHLYNFTTNNMEELLLVTKFSKPEIYYDFYTNLTKKLHINTILNTLNLFPPAIKSSFAWAHWFIAQKM